VATAHGTGLFVDSLRDVHDLNYVRVERSAGATELAAEAEALMAGFPHRRVVAYEPVGLPPLGWDATTHLVMAHTREPDRRVDTSSVREVPFEDLAPLRAADYVDAGLAERLNEGKRRVARIVETRWFAAEGAWCELRSWQGMAQIEDVNTLPAFRGRGLGRAVVQRALDEARRDHDLVWLEAVEDDWPRELYAKLGFEVVDRRHLYTLIPELRR
jgi:GNAT superfamily N-acetyltransferase